MLNAQANHIKFVREFNKVIDGLRRLIDQEEVNAERTQDLQEPT